MSKEIRKFMNRDFKKAKIQAKQLIENGFDTSCIIENIKSIRKELKIDRAITIHDIIQHIAIKITKKEIAIA